jgi:hypothetical protein
MKTLSIAARLLSIVAIATLGGGCAAEAAGDDVASGEVGGIAVGSRADILVDCDTVDDAGKKVGHATLSAVTAQTANHEVLSISATISYPSTDPEKGKAASSRSIDKAPVVRASVDREGFESYYFDVTKGAKRSNVTSRVEGTKSDEAFTRVTLAPKSNLIEVKNGDEQVTSVRLAKSCKYSNLSLFAKAPSITFE